MADIRISDLPADAAPTLDDIIMSIDIGTDIEKQITIQSINNLLFATAQTSISIGLINYTPLGTHEDFWSYTTDLHPGLFINDVIGSTASPTTNSHAIIFSERHIATATGDATIYYGQFRVVDVYESGHALHSEAGRFEIRDRSGINTKDRVALGLGAGALAANSGRGLWAGWFQVFDHADSDYPSICGFEIGITVNRGGLSYTTPWGGMGNSRTGIYVVNDALNAATAYRGHAAFNADGNFKGWQWGVALRKCIVGLYGFAYTDTDVDGIMLFKDSAGTTNIFGVSNTGQIRTSGNITLGQLVDGSGTIYFGAGTGGNDYLSYNGTDFDFGTSGASILKISATGLVKTTGGLHVGGTSDPGADNLLVDGTAEVTGISLFTGLVKTVGGLHVGGAADPGADNLIVDGTATVVGAFGCNAKAAQTAYVSGGALPAYGAGAFGLDSNPNMSALHAMVVAIRACLVANGIMS